MYNKTLDRQIKRYLKDTKRVAQRYLPFLQAVSDTYEHYEQDRVMLERSMDLSSRELTEVNEKFRVQNKELESQKSQLESALNELQAAQSQLIQAEKMAVLGQLVAGVAHEINTPIGAINAAAGVIGKLMPQVLQLQPQLFKDMTPETEEAFNHFVDKTLNIKNTLNTREERQYIRSITADFTEKKLPNAGSLATKLVRAGIVEDYDRYLPIFYHQRAEEILDMAMNIGRLRVNVENIATAVSKTQKIVFSLKSYAYRKADGAIAETANLVDNVSTVLTIYHNQLKHGINTTFEYDADPIDIECFADELNQVWTNIIHNAIQAMGGTGTLDIRIEKTDDGARVSFADSGPGVPPEIIEKIFQPFFTTKRQGEGSGLGLDICKKIIDKHHGKIEVQNSSTGAVFIVTLPARQPIVQHAAPAETAAAQS